MERICEVDDVFNLVCKKEVETMAHLLVGCNIVNFILTTLCIIFTFYQYINGSFRDFFRAFFCEHILERMLLSFLLLFV